MLAWVSDEAAMRQRTQPHIGRFAKALRRDPTNCERIIWTKLRALKPLGFHFRRQAPFRSYILDFVDHRHRLVVELDGAAHGWVGQNQRDLIRDAVLRAEGYRVLRFWNAEVMFNPDLIVERVLVEGTPHPTRLRRVDLPTGGRS
jgi:very-short-patch-repair endonuclease